MKSNYIIVAILLLIATFSFEAGSIFLPLWAYSCIAGASIIALVAMIARIHRQHTEHIEAQLNAIEKSLNKHSKDMTEHIYTGNETILKSLEGTNGHIADVGDQIKAELNEMKESIRLSTQETILKSLEGTNGHISDIGDQIKADMNERFRQILLAQASTNEEISSLTILLQAIQKSIEDRTIIKKEGEGDSIRIDRIIDEKTSNIVLNYMKDGQIIKSTMQNPQGVIIYELDFDSGNISRSRSYNDEGEMTIEQRFYENGQVHHRIEYTSKGKTITEFDLDGKKK